MIGKEAADTHISWKKYLVFGEWHEDLVFVYTLKKKWSCFVSFYHGDLDLIYLRVTLSEIETL